MDNIITTPEIIYKLQKILKEYSTDPHGVKDRLGNYFKDDFKNRNITGPLVSNTIAILVDKIIKLATKISRDNAWYKGRISEVLFEICKMFIYEKPLSRSNYRKFVNFHRQQKDKLEKMMKVMKKEGQSFNKSLENIPGLPLCQYWSICMPKIKSADKRRYPTLKESKYWMQSFIDDFEVNAKVQKYYIDLKLNTIKVFVTHEDAFLVDTQFFIRTIFTEWDNYLFDDIVHCFYLYGYGEDGCKLFQDNSHNRREYIKDKHKRDKIISDRLRQIINRNKSRNYIYYERKMQFNRDVEEGNVEGIDIDC